MCVDQLLGFLSSVSLPHGAKALDLAISEVSGAFGLLIEDNSWRSRLPFPPFPDQHPTYWWQLISEKRFSRSSLCGEGGGNAWAGCCEGSLVVERLHRTSRELGFTPRTTIKQWNNTWAAMGVVSEVSQEFTFSCLFLLTQLQSEAVYFPKFDPSVFSEVLPQTQLWGPLSLSGSTTRAQMWITQFLGCYYQERKWGVSGSCRLGERLAAWECPGW